LFGSPPIPATISFGRNCLFLVTEHSRVVEFPFPTAAATLIEARGFGLQPVSGSHFFARPSHGIGHKHPIRSSTPNPPPPLPLTIQRGPTSSPATSSPDLPEYESPPPPAFLSPGAQQLYRQGIDYLHSEECLYQPELTPEDWLAAYGATVVPNFTEQILGALLDSSVLAESSSAYLVKLTTSLDLVTAGFTYPPSNATQDQRFLATKILTLIPSSITVPLLFPAAARPSLSMAALYNMVAFENRRRKFRLTPSELQGPTKNQLVIALSSALPRQILDRSFPTSTTDCPLSFSSACFA